MADGDAPAFPTETIRVDGRTVACDGGMEPLGHPRVWLHIPGSEVVCPYCSRRYVLNLEAPAAAHH